MPNLEETGTRMKYVLLVLLLVTGSSPQIGRAAAPRASCCPYRFRLLIRHAPARAESFALIDVYTYGSGRAQHNVYFVQPYCGPAYFSGRPCAARRTYTVKASPGNFLPRSWTAQWVQVWQRRDVNEMTVFHSLRLAVSTAMSRTLTHTVVY